ncbi:MAG TPA: GspMb/PilO family protein, partial [archaeon]|nr:GspMb/PilO family protein [archaeon]
SGGIPPNQEAMDYLTSRDASLQRRYQHWLKRVAAMPPTEAATADPQLYFQEQLHEVQRTLERLAAARTMSVPAQLGFPKELPPPETVPRLLVQLSLIRDVAELVFAQGVTALASCKIEDPEPVAEQDGQELFLMRLPVRVRLTGSLAQLIKILGAIERVSPLIDLRAVQVVSADAPEQLEVDLVLARYLAMAPLP